MTFFSIEALALLVLGAILFFVLASWLISSPEHFKKRNKRRIDKVKGLFKRK